MIHLIAFMGAVVCITAWYSCKDILSKPWVVFLRVLYILGTLSWIGGSLFLILRGS